MAQEPLDASTIASRILTELSKTQFACSSLVPLSGGVGNFVYKAQLRKPLDDGTAEVAVKHGEGFAAQFPTLKLPMFRCEFESGCLQAIQHLAPITTDAYCVRTPRLLHFNAETTTQVQEYLAGTLNLKTYALRYFSQSQTSPSADPSEKAKIVEIGRGLGQWLRSFHDWSADPDQRWLRDKARMNKEMQDIKLTYNYERLLWQVDKFPSLLEPARSAFTEVIAMAKAEVVEEDKLHIIHGDFWTGNILLPNEEIQPDQQTVLSVVDWEMCQLSVRPLDLGQMIAELYELVLYKNIKAGLWIIEGFLEGYGYVNHDFTFRIAVHVGVHLVGFGTNVANWGDAEQVEKVTRTGRDIILQAWKKDRDWFKSHDLKYLFEKC